MKKEDVEHFKKRLLAEQKDLEHSLGKIAKVDPSNPQDWVPKPAPMDVVKSDKNDLADRFEDFEERRATELQLEIRLNNIKKALKRIEEGTYGTCEMNGEQIETERLNANPAAGTCIAHAK